MTRARLATAALLIAVIANSGDRARACFLVETIILVNIARPADPAAFDRGVLGVLHPTYERRFLIRAYRRMRGLETIMQASPDRAKSPAVDQPQGWLEARERVLKTGEKIDAWRFNRDRPLAEYRFFENCNDEAFQTATTTLEERIRQFGEQSAAVAAWLRAQDAVFTNCGGSGSVQVVLPESAPAGSDRLTRTDRVYQAAAARFYAMQYEAAESGFLAIADDASSPWRPYGRYLAARSLIRWQSVGVPALSKSEGEAVLDRADRHLQAVADDSSAPASLRESAVRMRALVALRVRTPQRFRALATLLATPGQIHQQDLTDYLLTFDSEINPNTEYDYESIGNRDRLAGDDLTDWLLAIQGKGAAARDVATARWQETRATHWLVAALWKAAGNEPATVELLRAAAGVAPDSSVYTTVSFLRARLLLARGDRPGARTLLASLPDQPSATIPADAVNLFRALRLQAADDLDSWLRAAPRVAASKGSSFSDSWSLDKPLDPSFDVDAALALTESFPLDRLVDAAAAPILPPRLRLIVASAAWTRAVQLRRDDAGLRVAPVITALAPTLREEMNRYVRAPNPDARHYAGVLTILRWPTFRNYVPLAEGSQAGFPPRFTQPSQSLDLNIRKHWWCGFGPMRTWTVSGPYEETPVTRLPELVYQAARIPPPAVISAADRSQATREFDALAAFGTAPNYLSSEAIAWARARPADPDVAEALARAVTSTRYGCTDKQSGAFSRQAFTILHRQYPATEWAKRTPFWYSESR